MDRLLVEAVKAHRRPEAFHLGACLRPLIENELMYCLNFHHINQDLDTSDYYKGVRCDYFPNWFGVTLTTGPEIPKERHGY